MKSDINPFDSQEAKPYKNDPEILAMTNLVNAYQTNDINEFESILKQNRQNIMDDPFIREHIEGKTCQFLFRHRANVVILYLFRPVAEYSDTSAYKTNQTLHQNQYTLHFPRAEHRRV